MLIIIKWLKSKIATRLIHKLNCFIRNSKPNCLFILKFNHLPINLIEIGEGFFLNIAARQLVRMSWLKKYSLVLVGVLLTDCYKNIFVCQKLEVQELPMANKWITITMK